MNLIKNLATSLLFLLITQGSQAGTEPVLTSRKQGSTHLRVDSTVVLQDDKLPCILLNNCSPSFITTRLDGGVILGIDQYSADCYPAFTVTFGLRVRFKDSSLVNDSVNVELTVEHDPAAGLKTDDRSIFRLPGVYKMDVIITSITSSLPGGILPESIYLENILVKERWYTMDYAVASVFNTVGVPQADELLVSWSAIPGAEEYDLEWLYIDDFDNWDGTTVTYKNPEDIAYRFENNSTRVTVKGTQFLLKNAYEHGYLLFRVRGVNYAFSNLRTRMPGKWSSYPWGDAGIVDEFGVDNKDKVAISSGHEPDLNWQWTMGFAEEGKNKLVVSYFDGTLRSRQMVTHNSTDHFSIVGESFYDHVGRASVSALPAPTGESIIKYYESFNVSQSTGDPYSYSDFDQTNGIDLCNNEVTPMDTTSGASRYYSHANPDKNGFQAYVPDAHLYPFVQTMFTPDMTGRVSRQGGVGPDHQLGSGHEIRYFYGSVGSQQELTALFGVEVGNYAHYKKNMVVDPNGQVSVSYINPAGAVIATSLAGTPPANVIALTQDTAKKLVSANLHDKNRTSFDGKKWTVTHSLTLSSPTEVSLDYSFADIKADMGCEADGICYTCVYDLRIAIEDNCGDKVMEYQARRIQPFDTTCAQDTFAYEYAETLGIGTYLITKELSVNEEAFEEYLDVFVRNQQCVASLESIYDSLESQIDYSDCFTDCRVCFDSLGTFEDFVDRRYIEDGADTNAYMSGDSLIYEYSIEYAQFYQMCSDLCDTIQYCDAMLNMLLQDVSPGGQYMKYETDEEGLVTVADYLSLLQDSEDNAFPNTAEGKRRNWKASDIIYFDESGDTSVVLYEGEWVRPNALPLQEFLTAWQPSWANSLVILHPEYCYYKWCLYNDEANDFDFQLSATSTYAEAEDQLLFNPLKINHPDAPGTYSSMSEDPFFATGGWGYFLRSEAVTKCSTYTTLGSSTYSIWDMAVIMTYCNDAASESDINACLAAHTFGTGDTADLNVQWRHFVGFYRGIRSKLIDSARTKYANDSSCTNCYIGNNGAALYSTSCNTDFDHDSFSVKQKLFPGFNESLGINLGDNEEDIIADARGISNGAMEEYCLAQCSAYADLWMQRLDSCDFDDADSMAIRDSLITICSRGCDRYNPMGSSSVSPENEPLQQFDNFGALLESFDIPNFRSKVCNEHLLQFPLPYGADLSFGSNAMPDDCFRETITNFVEDHECGVNSQTIALFYIINDLIADNALVSPTEIAFYPMLGTTAQGLFDSDIKPVYFLHSSQTNTYKTEIDGDGNLVMIFIARHGDVVSSCSLTLHLDPANMPFDYTAITSFDVFNPVPTGCATTGEHTAYSSFSPFSGTGTPYVTSECFRFCDFSDTFTTAEYVQKRLQEEYCLDIPLDIVSLYMKMACGDTTVFEFVPAELKCYQSCIACTEIREVKQAFAVVYDEVFDLESDDLESDTGYIETFAGFANSMLGFKQDYESYAILMANCDQYTDVPDEVAPLTTREFLGGLAAKDIAKLRKGCFDWPPSLDSDYIDTIGLFLVLCNEPIYDPGVAPDTISCDSLKRQFAYQQAEYLYNLRLEDAKADFRQQYYAKCTAIMGRETFTLDYELKEHHFTLYYYDQASNLIKTVPPEGFHPITHPDTLRLADTARKYKYAASYSNTPHHTFVTNYKYNSLQEVTVQYTPDGDTSKFYYDRLGRLVVSQNARQKEESLPANKKYSYTRYDELGRISEVGEAYSPNAMTTAISANNAGLAAWMMNCYEFKQVTYTMYDEPLDNADLLSAFKEGEQSNLRNRVSYVYNFGDEVGSPQDGHLTAYSYDIHGNVKELIQDFASLGVLDDRFGTFSIRYDYDLISGNVNQVKYQEGKTDRFYHKYEYDADNRIQTVYTSKDNLVWDADARYAYYQHGPLARVETGELSVQGTDYAYTIHGWLKGVNSATLDSTRDIGKDGLNAGNPNRRFIPADEFGFTLGYYQEDYSPINAIDNKPKFTLYAANGSGFDNAAPSLYNGNIRHMTVAIAKFMEGSPTAKPVGYAYKYDQLNRIREMNTYDSIDMGGNNWYIAAGALPYYHNRFTYDANGNILSQVRRGGRKGPIGLDSLVYHYDNGNNQLSYVDDPVSSGNYGTDIDDQDTFNYKYDAIGNLIYDRAEGIDSIKWNVYGKISHIYRSEARGLPDLEFQYGPDGQRTRKRSLNLDSTVKMEYYVRDAMGNIMAMYNMDMPLVDETPDTSYHHILAKLLNMKGEEAFAEFMASTFTGNSTWREKVLEYLPPSGMDTSFTMEEVQACMGDYLYARLFGNCDSCNASISERVYDSLINASYYGTSCVGYSEWTPLNLIRDYATWPGPDFWSSLDPNFNWTHDVGGQRLMATNTSPGAFSSLNANLSLAPGAYTTLNMDVDVSSGYDDITVEIWDGPSLLYNPTVNNGTFQNINQSFSCNSGVLSVRFVVPGSPVNTQFYLDNFQVQSYVANSTSDCIQATSNTSGLDTVFMLLWNCNPQKITEGFLAIDGLREQILRDLGAAEPSYISSVYSYLSSYYAGTSENYAFLAYFADPNDVAEYLFDMPTPPTPIYDVLNTGYMAYLKEAIDRVYTPCELMQCLGSCAFGVNSPGNTPGTCSNLLTYKLNKTGDYSDDLLEGDDKFIYSQMFYCQPEAYGNKVVQNMAAMLSQDLINTVYPEVFDKNLQNYPYAALLEQVAGPLATYNDEVLNRVSDCDLGKLLKGFMELYPREFLTLLDAQVSLTTICSGMSVTPTIDAGSTLMFETDQSLLIAYLSTNYPTQCRAAIAQFGMTQAIKIKPVIFHSFTACDFKSCLASFWNTIGYDSSLIFDYAKLNDWVNIANELYTEREWDFNYYFSYIYRPMAGDLLENWHYPVKDFFTNVESYFGTSTRDSLDSDTITVLRDLFVQEYHLYGSSRLGVLKQVEKVKRIELQYHILLTDVDSISQVQSYEYLTNVYDSIYTQTRGSKLYEGSNHLGNVLVTYSDKLLSTCVNDTINYYMADLRSATDYSAFGALLDDRQWYSSADSSGYRFGFNGAENDNEAKGVGNSLDFGARIYDSRLGNWMSVDPKENEDPQFSPYVAFANNPLVFVDPNGEKYLKFNQAGEFIGVEKDTWWHNLFIGAQGRIVDDQGKVTRTFTFSDEHNDPIAIENGTITHIVFVTASQIELMLGRAGVFDPANKSYNKPAKERYEYILANAKGNGGNMDFSYSQIPRVFPDASADPLETPSSMIFLVEEGERLRAYNHMNFGNFLFGAAGQALGLTVTELRAGGHYNSIKNPETNGYGPQIDSPDDQGAIRAGHAYGESKGYDMMEDTDIEYGAFPEKR